MKDTISFDQRLIKIAKKAFYTSVFDQVAFGDLDKVFRKETLSAEERSDLLKFVEVASGNTRPMSMSYMKREIFAAIKYDTETSGYITNTISATELRAIHAYIMSTPKQTPKKTKE